MIFGPAHLARAVAELIERIVRYGQRVEADLDAPLVCRDPKDD